MFNSKYSFNHIKLRNKLLIMYILSVFLPIVLTNVIFYNVTTNNIKKQKMQDDKLVLQQITNEFHYVIDSAVGVSSSFYTDALLYEFFDKDYETIIDYVEAYDVYLRDLNRYNPMFYSVQSINFYTDNPTVLYAGGVNPVTSNTMEQDWYNRISEVSHPIVIRTNPRYMNDTFSVIRELDYYKNRNYYQKIMKIDINPSVIKSIFENITFQGNLYLVNGNGMIEYATDDNLNWRLENYQMDDLELSSDSILIDENYMDSHYLNNWKIVGVISEKETFEEIFNSRRFIIILACLNILIPTLIIILISRSLNQRLLRLLRYMKKLKDQKFETISIGEDNDEIGQLTSEFNRMSRTINKLINDVYIVNLQKKDLALKKKQAQLSALQSQINPHFLFNALETIRMRSLIKEEHETARIIQNMAKIFRNSLTWGKDWVTVRDEMKLVICFLEIQKYRFGEKLEYEINIDENAYDSVIPNMAFLPFVENASIHGIEPIKGIGKIHLQIQLVNDELIYTLTDNGIGMSEEKVNQLLTSLKNKESMGENVGIRNVYYRLKMYYSTDFVFNIESSPGKGTTVQIKLLCKK